MAPKRASTSRSPCRPSACAWSYTRRPAILGRAEGDTMKKLVAAFAALALSASMNFALAQDKKAEKDAGKATMKVVAENAKARAVEVTYPPGAENTAVPSSKFASS